MTAKFEIVQEGVVANRYSEPLVTTDIERMVDEDNQYAQKFGKHIYVISDFSQVKSFSGSLLALALRPAEKNPIRSPQVEAIFVICNVLYLEQLASIVTKVLRINKLTVVNDWNEALEGIGKLVDSPLTKTPSL